MEIFPLVPLGKHEKRKPLSRMTVMDTITLMDGHPSTFLLERLMYIIYKALGRGGTQLAAAIAISRALSCPYGGEYGGEPVWKVN